jgi:hypothetical protein
MADNLAVEPAPQCAARDCEKFCRGHPRLRVTLQSFVRGTENRARDIPRTAPKRPNRHVAPTPPSRCTTTGMPRSYRPTALALVPAVSRRIEKRITPSRRRAVAHVVAALFNDRGRIETPRAAARAAKRNVRLRPRPPGTGSGAARQGPSSIRTQVTACVDLGGFLSWTNNVARATDRSDVTSLVEMGLSRRLASDGNR